MIKVIFEGSIFLHQKKEEYQNIYKKFIWDKCTLETGKLYRQLASHEK